MTSARSPASFTIGRSLTSRPHGRVARPTPSVATGVPPRTVREIAARYRERAPGLAHGLLALSVALGHHLPLAVDIPLDPERRAAFGLGAAWLAARHRGTPGATPWRWLAAITGGRVLSTNTRSPTTGRRGLPVLGHGPLPGLGAGPQAARAGYQHPSARAPPSVVRAHCEFRGGPSPPTAAATSPRSPAGSSPNSVAGNTRSRAWTRSRANWTALRNLSRLHPGVAAQDYILTRVKHPLGRGVVERLACLPA